MSCISFSNLCPSSGDTENVLLQKILQSLNESGGSGGVAGVSSLNVNGSGPQTGAVSITIPDALFNFQDQNADADGVVYINSGATEIFRTVGTTSFLKFTTNATTMRLHTSALDDSFTFLASPAKADGGFLEVYGTSHLTGLGGATISIHDGGQFRIRSAPVASTVSVLRFSVDGTGAVAMVDGNTSTTTPSLSGVVTWNNVATIFTGWKLNVTNTLSAATSKLLDLQVGSTSMAVVSWDGVISGDSSQTRAFSIFTTQAAAIAGTVALRVGRFGSVGVALASEATIAWSSNAAGAGDASGTGDTFLRRDQAAGVLALSINDGSATPFTFRVYETASVGLTDYSRVIIQAQAGNHLIRTEAGGASLIAGQPRILQVGTGPSVGTDVAGQSVLWHSGQGTGTGTGGSHLFQVSAPAATSGVVNVLATRLTLNTTDLTMATAVRLAVATGANQRAGNATLIAGSVTVANTTVTANTIVLYSRKTSGGTIGTAMTYTVSAATSFTLTSDSALDTSTFSYFLIEVP